MTVGEAEAEVARFRKELAEAPRKVVPTRKGEDVLDPDEKIVEYHEETAPLAPRHYRGT